VEIGIGIGECQWLMYMFWARVILYLCFGAEVPMYLWYWGHSSYVILFRLEYLCD
jgi:hypothetical protein